MVFVQVLRLHLRQEADHGRGSLFGLVDTQMLNAISRMQLMPAFARIIGLEHRAHFGACIEKTRRTLRQCRNSGPGKLLQQFYVAPRSLLFQSPSPCVPQRMAPCLSTSQTTHRTSLPLSFVSLCHASPTSETMNKPSAVAKQIDIIIHSICAGSDAQASKYSAPMRRNLHRRE